MTPAEYAAGATAVVLIAVSLAAGAVAARRRWLSGWTGAPARLAEAVGALTALVVLSEALGTINGFSRTPLVIAAVASGVLTTTMWRTASDDGEGDDVPRVPPGHRWAAPVATLMGGMVIAEWSVYARAAYRAGITSVDSLHYHLPFAARFFQAHEVSRLTFLWIDPVWSFYPSNAELFHAVGMVTLGRDVLSPLLNVGWLVLALVSSWVVGHRFGVGHLTVAVVVLVLAAPFTAPQAGSAGNDAPALALLLASLALVMQDDHRPSATIIAGLAAGMACGTKMTALAPALALTVVVTARVPRGRRLSTAATWTGALAVAGGYWFLRNLVRTGSPMPALAIPGLPSPRLPVVEAYGYSVADYLGDGRFWRSVVPDGLRQVFGATYPIVLALAAAGLLVGIRIVLNRTRAEASAAGSLQAGPARRPAVAMLLVMALLAGTAYVMTPLTAYGPRGDPFLFGANLRYGFPALLAGLLLVPLALPRARARWSTALLLAVALVLAVELGTGVRPDRGPLRSRPSWFVAVLVVWAAAWTIGRHRRLTGVDRRVRAMVVAGALILLVAVGYRPASTYLDRRYKVDPIWAWAQTVHDARIAVVGYAQQYPLAGSDLSNHVQYLGEEGWGGSFESYRRCEDLMRALHAGRYDFLVAGSEKWGVEPAREQRWVREDPSLVPLVGPSSHPDVRATVFRVDARQPARSCR
jgi:hypothetical protein